MAKHPATKASICVSRAFGVSRIGWATRTSPRTPPRLFFKHCLEYSTRPLHPPHSDCDLCTLASAFASPSSSPSSSPSHLTPSRPLSSLTSRPLPSVTNHSQPAPTAFDPHTHHHPRATSLLRQHERCCACWPRYHPVRRNTLLQHEGPSSTHYRPSPPLLSALPCHRRTRCFRMRRPRRSSVRFSLLVMRRPLSPPLSKATTLHIMRLSG